VINRLATLNPLWTFVAVSRPYNMQMGYRVTDFVVRLDGERLGTISTSYMGSRGNVIAIANDRISKNRQRSDSYRTQDADKAILMAKKMFGKMNPSERIDKAKEAAERVVTRASWNKERERNNLRGMVQGEMLRWVETKGYEMFLQFVATEAPITTRNSITGNIDKLEVLDTEMKTIEKVQEHFGANKTALVVRDLGKYLVKVGDKVDMYDDNTLPQDMRMKLGMLKLVEDEQYLTEIGCKVTSEIFVLLVD